DEIRYVSTLNKNKGKSTLSKLQNNKAAIIVEEKLKETVEIFDNKIQAGEDNFKNENIPSENEKVELPVRHSEGNIEDIQENENVSNFPPVSFSFNTNNVKSNSKYIITTSASDDD